MSELIQNEGRIISLLRRPEYSKLAVEKIAKELEEFNGGNKEKAVSKFVASTLTHFCEDNERFAEAVYKTKRTLSDCCAEVMMGVSNQVSDIDVYRGAVRHYFPNSDISFKMEITINGEDPSEEDLTREPKKKAYAPKHNKKANKEESEDVELDEDEDDTEEVAAPAPRRERKAKAEKPKKTAPANVKAATKKPEKEVIQIFIFESMFGEGN